MKLPFLFQVFHICDGGRKISFLCPNGTIFRQSNLICDWWFKVDCADSPGQYEESAEHLAEDQRRAGKPKNSLPPQNFETIHTTQRRPPSNFGSEIITGHNHISDYKAEASFNSVSQSGAPATGNFRTEHRNSKPSPRSFQAAPRQQEQAKVTNSRQYPTYDQSTQATKFVNSVQDEENQRKSTANTYKYTPTRRTTLEYTDAAVYRGSTQPSRNYKEPKETQVVAESASFVNSRGRNTYNHFSANYDNKVKSTIETTHSESYPTTARTTRPSYTTTYVPGSKNYVEVTRSVSHSVGTSTRSKPTSQVSYSISTTARTPSATTRNNTHSLSQYYQSTADSENNFRVTRVPTSTTFRTAKGFQLPSKDNQNVPQSTAKNSWQINLKTENVTFYAPTVPTVTPKTFNVSTNQFSVPTVTPKPYSAQENTFSASNWYTTVKSDAIITTLPESTYSTYKAEPTVSEHAVDMLKTLEELEFGNGNPTTEADKILGTRTGLVVPPSAGPNTLHSLAIYFATAVDNLVSTLAPTTVTEENRDDSVTDEDQYHDTEYSDSFTSILSQKTIDKYSNLFKNDSSSESAENVENSEEIANNDLESSQSRGPLSSSPQIRELAQVFTHALSAYLQDPETFRKVLSEIRPTDPTNEVTKPTVNTLAVEEVTPANDLYSISKDEDEVLDFSDVSKNSVRPTPTPQEVTSTTLSESTKAYSVDLIKNRLLLTTSGYRHQTPIAHSNTQSKTPASSFVTHDTNNFDSSQNDLRQGKELTSTVIVPSTKNAIAVEINGGLSVSTPKKGPKKIEQERQHTNCSETAQFNSDSSYFPVKNDETAEPIPRYGGFQNNSGENLSPYGTGLQSFNSTPINVVFSETQTATEPIPLQWGDATSTKVTTIAENPSAPYQDLVPPSQDARISDTLDSDELSEINSFIPKEVSDFENKDQTVEIDFQTTEQPKTTVSGKEQHATFKYRSHSADRGMYYSNYKATLENEEQLQRAHSQSFISSANQIGRRGKKIESASKSTKNDSSDSDKPNVNVTSRTSDGANSLPTLKDILLKPTSTVPTDTTYTTIEEKNKEESFTTVSSTEPTTVINIQETTQGTTGFEESTTQYEAPTTVVYSNPSTNPQSTTNQENIWSTSAALGQIWQTTVFLDPITINDGLSSDAAHETLFPSANTYFQGPSTKQGDFFTDKTSEPSTTTTLDSDRIDLFKYPAISTITGAPEETTTFTEETTTSYPETPVYESFPPIFSTAVESRNSFEESPKNQTSDDIIIVSSSNRGGKSLSSAPPSQVLAHLPASEVDQTMMNKAKEMFGGLNESSANTLMNVMKKADKNTTVRRLILLLVQTCDDDHNKTIEASRTALLDALMRIPYAPEEVSVTQNPTIADLEQTVDYEPKTTIRSPDYSTRRIDEIIDTDDSIYPAVSLKTKGRQGKRIDFDASYPNSLQETQKSTSVVTEVPLTTTSAATTTSTTTQAPITTVTEALIVPTTDSKSALTEPPTSKATETTLAESTNTVAPVVTVKMSRRGQRKFYVKTTKTPIYPKAEEKSTAAEKQTLSSVEDHSVPSDTRALELLRSLYSLAARWG